MLVGALALAGSALHAEENEILQKLNEIQSAIEKAPAEKKVTVRAELVKRYDGTINNYVRSLQNNLKNQILEFNKQTSIGQTGPALMTRSKIQQNLQMIDTINQRYTKISPGVSSGSSGRIEFQIIGSGEVRGRPTTNSYRVSFSQFDYVEISKATFESLQRSNMLTPGDPKRNTPNSSVFKGVERYELTSPGTPTKSPGNIPTSRPAEKSLTTQ